MPKRPDTTAESDSHHSGRRTLHVAVAAVLLLAAYPLSFGPVTATRAYRIQAGRWDYDGLPARATRFIYRPLKMSNRLDGLMDRYFVWSHTLLYGPPPIPSPPPG